jgi:hypothetical protein
MSKTTIISVSYVIDVESYELKQAIIGFNGTDLPSNSGLLVGLAKAVLTDYEIAAALLETKTIINPENKNQ